MKISFIFMMFVVSQTFPLSNAASDEIKINGAGASAPYPIYSKWFTEYHKINSHIFINYQAIGSGGGIRQLINQTVDFAASDTPMKDSEKKQMPYDVLEIPSVLSAVAIAYNLPEVPSLKLDSETLADIYLGKITNWGHPQIQNLNPSIKLPPKDILVLRRSDGSGTTYMFSHYLTNVNREWSQKVGKGKALKWPTGLGAKGNEGITGLLKLQPSSIGYIELSYAVKNKLGIVQLKNETGHLVAPDTESIEAHADNPKNYNAYPISDFTYLLVPIPIPIPIKATDKKSKAMKEFLLWALQDGQRFAKDLYYAPLPESYRNKFIKLVEQMK